MAKKNILNSKNLANTIESMISEGKFELATQLLNSAQVLPLVGNILKSIKRKEFKRLDFNRTKIYSQTDLDKSYVDKLGSILKINTEDTNIIIDKNLGAGIKIKSGEKVIDATLESMLESKLKQLLNN